MAVRRTIAKPGLYFITFTCYHWLPLIDCTDSYNAVYKCPSERSSGRSLIT